MNLYKVIVECWYQPVKDPGKRDKQPRRKIKSVIVSDETIDPAMRQAEKWAEEHAEITGARWIAFKATEAATIKVPYEI